MTIGGRLRKRWYLVVLAVIIGVLVAGVSLVRVGSGGIHEKRSVYQVALGEVLVDTDPSQLTNVTGAAGALAGRAQLIAQYGTGAGVVARIAQRAGVPAASLTVQAQTTAATSTGGSASKELKAGAGPNSILLRTTSVGQTISISAQARGPKKAVALAQATIYALRTSLTDLQNAQSYNHVTTTTTSTTTTTGKAGPGTAAKQAAAKQAAAKQAAAKQAAALQNAKASKVTLSKIVLRPIGSVTATKVVSTPKKSKAIEYGLGAFIALLIIIILLDALISPSRAAVAVPAAPTTSGSSSEATIRPED